ncbi:protein kinase domain-containing protein [Rubrivirga sp. IMCC45206]|uniref:protein kinase domain-containing protein n=1 Tax=Rubrivirga sp. IMCC45206 TaxID=3391614 RepID=UPI00398FF58D
MPPPPAPAIAPDVSAIRPFAELARGPVATVYKAVDPDGTVVLLKQLRAVDDERRARFAQEARLAATVVHPNVVRVLAADADALVAEWVEGADLGRVVAEQGPLPPALAAFVARDAALGLAAVHAAGILHRDVSPANVLLGLDGAVKLTDFGLASLGADDDEVRGTLGAIAPEVVRGDAPDARSDLFSLGAVLALALSGRAPFAADGTAATLDAVVNTDAGAALAADPRVPPALAAVAAALLAKDPADRPATAVDAADALAAVLPTLGAPDAGSLAAYLADPAGWRPPAPVAAPALPVGTPPAGPARSRQAWALALAAVAVLAVGAWWLGRPADRAPVAAEPSATAPVEIARADPADTDPAPLDEPTRLAEPVDPADPPPADPPPEPGRARSEPDERETPAAPTPARPTLPADRPPPAPAPPATGTLTVAAQPWARVAVDGRDLGTTPVAAVELAAGAHTLTLTNPDFPPHTVQINVAPGERTDAVVSLWSLVGRIDIEVSPWAEVAVDGRAWDTVPPQTRPLVLAPGDHVLTFTHPTLGTREVPLRVAAGERRTVRVRLGDAP